MRPALTTCFWIAASVAFGAPPSVSAQEEGAIQDLGSGAAVAVITPERTTEDPGFVTLSTGGIVLLRGQRFVVTNEPAPIAAVTEAPPPPPRDATKSAETSIADAIWVPGYWRHGTDGFVWVEGCHIAPKQGHVFVPPRWVSINGHFLFFNGFFVPHRVWVRSFFNTYHFSGEPGSANRSASRDRGPYWPIGVSGRPVGRTTTRGRGPYWPVGLGPPTVLNRRGGSVVGLPSNNARR
ncbi:MAG: hypothetical protein AAF500_12980 [Myxococcota bacterium]